jgi:hypothetical protein
MFYVFSSFAVFAAGNDGTVKPATVQAASPQPVSAQPVNTPSKIDSFTVTDVSSDRGKNTDRAGIDSKILVKVDHLAELIKQAGEVDNIKLKINNIVFSNLKPVRKVDDQTLEYQLVKDDKNNAQWDSLSVDVKKMVFPVKISLFLDNQDNAQPKIAGYDYKLILQTFRTGSTLFIVTVIIIGMTFFKLGKFDARLRSYGPTSPYSLALVQMAAWYCVVTLAYIYLYKINGCPPTLNNSIMILIGISSATALGARIVDSSNISKKESQGSDISSDSNLHSAVKENTLSEKVEKITSKGMLRDILSDEYGLALSRYQIVIWTFIMLYIFVKDVLSLGLLHDFSEGELLLMGISSGSYVGYKLNEDPSKKVK